MPRTRPTGTRSCRRGVRKRVSVEVGVSLGWERWVGDEGAIIGLDHFGASAPGRHDLRAFRVHRRRGSRTSAGASSATGCTAGSRRSTAATSPTWAAAAPDARAGDAGVDRTEDSDPGHS